MHALKTTPNWFLETLTNADRLAPGILLETLSGGPKRQQTVAAALALADGGAAIEDGLSNDLCALIKSTKTSNLLPTVCPTLHPDYAALIGNPKHSIFSKQLYRYLALWMEADPSKRTLKALHHGPAITGEVLVILDVLDESAHTADVLAIIPELAVAEQLNNEIKIVKRCIPNLQSDQLAQAIDAMASDYRAYVSKMLAGEGRVRQPDSLYERLVEHFAFPSPPLKPHPCLTPLTTAKALKEVGRTMHNCAESLIESAALGGDYYYVWAPIGADDPQAFVQLSRTGSFWRIERVSGYDNDDLCDERRRILESHFEAAGAVCAGEWPPRFLSDYIWQDAEEFAARWHGVKTLAA